MKNIIEQYTAIYVFLDNSLIEIGHKEPVNWNTADSQIITVAFFTVKSFQVISLMRLVLLSKPSLFPKYSARIV
jgi:hypothetical protein